MTHRQKETRVFFTLRTTPTGPGRLRECSETAVKTLRQKRQPASPLSAGVGEAGFFIEGCPALRAPQRRLQGFILCTRIFGKR